MDVPENPAARNADGPRFGPFWT